MEVKESVVIDIKTRKPKHPHDHLVKRLLSNMQTAKDILSQHLPENVKNLVDLNNLSLQRDSFIDDQHRVFAVDLLYKTTFAKEEGYLWVLLEHQRKEDPWLPVRIFKYMGTIWDHLRTERKSSKNNKIPLIYPIVIYNGKRPYSHTLTLKDMLQPDSSKKVFDTLFKTPFCLVDLAAIEDENLLKQIDLGVALLMTLKHVSDKNLTDFFVTVLAKLYQQLDQPGYADAVADIIYYLLNNGNLNKEKFWTIVHHEFSTEVEDKLMTLAQELRNDGRLEGKIEGRLEKTLEFAEALIARSTEVSLITELTGLSPAQIEKLRLKAH